MELMTLINILEESVVRNGEKPLTNKWLLSICKMVQRVEEEKAKEIAREIAIIADDSNW